MRKIIIKCLFISIFFNFLSFSYANPSLNKKREYSKSFVSDKLKKERIRTTELKKNYIWTKHKGSPLPEYEKLTYTLMWNFIESGEAFLEIKGYQQIFGRKAIHVYSYARSNRFLDAIYKIQSINEAWIDEESMLSLKFITNISEVDRDRREAIYFNHIEGTYRVYDNNKMGMGSLKSDTRDILTALYYMRTQDIKTGKEYILNILTGDFYRPVKIKVLGKQKIKIPAGEFSCFVLEPTIKESAESDQAERLRVWITDDMRKTPVYFELSLPIGPIQAAIIKIDRNIN